MKEKRHIQLTYEDAERITHRLGRFRAEKVNQEYNFMLRKLQEFKDNDKTLSK